MKVLKSFKCSLFKYRKKYKLTQRAVAAELGITHVHYCNIENDKALPSLSLAFNAANLFGCEVTELWKAVFQ